MTEFLEFFSISTLMNACSRKKKAWMDGWIDKYMDGERDGWIRRYTLIYKEGWMDGWMDRQTFKGIVHFEIKI